MLEMIKGLPVKPQKVEKPEGGSIITVSIKLEKLQELTKAFSKEEFAAIRAFLDENKYELAWDGKFMITSPTFTFTELLKTS